MERFESRSPCQVLEQLVDYPSTKLFQHLSSISFLKLFVIKGIRLGSKVLHYVTRNKRYFAGSAFRFMNGLVSLRLRWALDHYENLRRAADEGNALFGTIETFLIHK